MDLGELLGDLCEANPRVKWQPRVRCCHPVDPLALRRIVGNLLENALRYSQGEVEMRLDCCAQPPVILVLDRGPGIPEQEREAVFRPFYRLEHSRNRATGGSGLGLAVSRQLALANGIDLRLEPRPGGGLIASLRLAAARRLGQPGRSSARRIQLTPPTALPKFRFPPSPRQDGQGRGPGRLTRPRPARLRLIRPPTEYS